MAKWEAYPIFGLLVKIDYISMYTAIGLIILSFLFYFFKFPKLQKVTSILSVILTLSVILARILNSIDTTNYDICLYIYLICTIVFSIISILLLNKVKLPKSLFKITLILLLIIISLFLFNDNIYPYKIIRSKYDEIEY